MDSKVNYTVVGLFVIFLTAAIIFSIIWLSVGFYTKDYNTYEVYMNESVAGLNIDAPVRFNGVEIGKVKAINLHPENPQIVCILLDIIQGTPISVSTVAVLSTQGLTGVAYIDLLVKGLDKRPLLRLPGQKYPIIRSSPSLFLRIDQAITEITNDFNNISESLTSLLDVENRRTVKSTLKNLDRITGELAGKSKEIRSIIDNTATATKKLPHLFQSGQTTFGTINTQTLPKVNDILMGVQGVTNNLLDTSQTIKQNPAVLLRGQEPRPLGPGER